MNFRPEHELHTRRFSRNIGLGLVLAAFVALIFGLTVVKITEGDVARAIAGASSNE
ncbi:MAG: hypothetical protein ACO3K9_11125 [Paracoccaceae bacterium]|jgi:hypothetical protein|nr:hypothetical protein [Paracoccaceae bacterium]MDA0319958.1 hypothetical protein [Pseudomonadota bacterium]MDA0852413.1 hypothetical protein [Pseudomonadota bacterium]MDA1295499.1 hypothetical protein [Pseudomonadota bacterium]